MTHRNLIPDWPENCRGYRLSADRIAELTLEYVRYRKPDGTIPQPYLDLISALSELAAYRRFERDTEPASQLREGEATGDSLAQSGPGAKA